MNTLTRKELKLLVALLGGADAVRKMVPNFHTDSGWQDAKHPNFTFGQEEALLNILGVQGALDVLNGKEFMLSGGPTARQKKKTSGLLTTYDQSLGSMELIKRALGPDNAGNLNRDITQERFPLKGTDRRTVNMRVEPFLNGETGEQAAKRLVAAGHVLANIGDLAGYLHDHPEEV